MYKLKKIKTYTLYSTISLIILTSITLAAGGGTIGSLFQEISTDVYKLTGTNIVDDSITTTQIRDGSITGIDIQNNTILGVDIANNSITTDKIQVGGVTSSDILNNTITESDIIDSFKARDADKLDGKKSTTILGTNDTTIPTSKAVRDYVNSSPSISTINDLTDAVATSKNLGLGQSALDSNTSGTYNTAVGLGALTSNTSGKYNTANGYQSLEKNISGRDNTAHGYKSLEDNTYGSRNATFGYQSLQGNISGSRNTAIGYQTLKTNETGHSNVAIGSLAGYFEKGSNKLYIDNSSTTLPLIYGDFSANTVKINGKLYVTGNPVAGNEVATKSYVDAQSGQGNMGTCPPKRTSVHDTSKYNDEFLGYQSCEPKSNGITQFTLPAIFDAGGTVASHVNYFVGNSTLASVICNEWGLVYDSHTNSVPLYLSKYIADNYSLFIPFRYIGSGGTRTPFYTLKCRAGKTKNNF